MNEPELMVSLKAIDDVEPDARVAVDRKTVDVAVVERPYQHDPIPPVSAEPVLQVDAPSSLNFCAKSAVVLAETL